MFVVEYPNRRRDGDCGGRRVSEPGWSQAHPRGLHPASLGLGCPRVSSIFPLSPLGELPTKVHLHPHLVNEWARGVGFIDVLIMFGSNGFYF